MRIAVAIVLGLLLSGSAAIARPCPTPCKKQLNLAFKACKATCPKHRAGRACRSQCSAQHGADRRACRASANPTPPSCGAEPSTTIATSSTTSSTDIPSTTITTTSSTTTTTMLSCSNQPDETACSDGNACTTGDRCQAGSCVPLNTVSCIAQDQCHDVGTCDPATGVCSNPSKPDGAACDDGQACTQSDTCRAGVCTGSNPVVCPAPPDQCQDALCDPAKGDCVTPPKADGAACNDGNACTQGDRCVGGACTGLSQTVCIFSPDQCHDAGTCDPATGLCTNPAKPNGTACNDGTACTTTDTCQGGVCTGFGPVLCQPPGPCQDAGSCNPTTGQCSYPSKADGTTCTDGNGCTSFDRCQAGACVGFSVECDLNPSPDQCHHAVSDCNPSNGVCVPRPKTDGTVCDDGDECTTGDSCQAGTCTGEPCGAGHACCSTHEACADLNFDSANCGGCGNVCTNSACLFGQCYNGCVIDGVGYVNGVHNPAPSRSCEICDTTVSRTTWTKLGENFPNPPTFTCTEGCFRGFCNRGDCTGLAQIGVGGGCTAASSCAAASCNQNGVCVQTPTNEGGACTPFLSANPCKSSTSGTCRAGDCVPSNANEGGYCGNPTSNPADHPLCDSTVAGSCASGTCRSNRLPVGSTCYFVNFTGGGNFVPNYCMVGTCTADGACTFPPIQCPNGVCPNSTVDCTVNHQYCATPDYDGTCDPATGRCVYPKLPFPDSTAFSCGNFAQGDDPSLCCPDEVCRCPATAPGDIPDLCIGKFCFKAGDPF